MTSAVRLARGRVAVVMALAVALSLGGCGVPRMPKPTRIADRDVPVAVRAPTTFVDVYFYFERRLRFVRRAVPMGAEPLGLLQGIAALIQKGPTAKEAAQGFTGRLGDYQFRVARIEDDTAVVALPSEGSAGTGLEGDPDAMAQLVWTLTAVDRLTNVSLERDGKRLSSVRADNSQSVIPPVKRDNYQTFGVEEEPIVYLIHNGLLHPVTRRAPAPTLKERQSDPALIASSYLDLLANGPKPAERSDGYTSLVADLEAKVRIDDNVPVLSIANAAAFDRLSAVDQARALGQMLFTINQVPQLLTAPAEIEVGGRVQTSVAGPGGDAIRAPVDTDRYGPLLEPVLPATTTTVA